MAQPDTKTRILDAAEQLFARFGFENTSMRAITGKAGANLAAANYHFGSKEALLKAVIERRLLPLNQERMGRIEQVLAAADRAGQPPDVRDLMRGFVEPTLKFSQQDCGTRAFISLIGRAMTEMDSTIRNIFIHQVEPLFKLTFSSLQRALPDQPTETLFTRLQFALGAMARTICMQDQSPIPIDAPLPTLDPELLAEELIDFIAAGLEAPC